MENGLQNPDGSVTIAGVNFDIPAIDSAHKRNYREWKEAKSKFQEVWIDSWTKVNGHMEFMSCALVLKNSNLAFLDGKRLKDDDAEKAKFIFKAIDRK